MRLRACRRTAALDEILEAGLDNSLTVGVLLALPPLLRQSQPPPCSCIASKGLGFKVGRRFGGITPWNRKRRSIWCRGGGLRRVESPEVGGFDRRRTAEKGDRGSGVGGRGGECGGVTGLLCCVSGGVGFDPKNLSKF